IGMADVSTALAGQAAHIARKLATPSHAARGVGVADAAEAQVAHQTADGYHSSHLTGGIGVVDADIAHANQAAYTIASSHAASFQPHIDDGAASVGEAEQAHK